MKNIKTYFFVGILAVMAFVTTFQTCSGIKSKKQLAQAELLIGQQDIALEKQQLTNDSLATHLENARQTIMEGPATITKWLPQETKIVKVEDTSQTDFLRNQLNQAINNPDCSQQIKVALEESKNLLDIVDDYRSTTHYEAEDVRSGYTFKFQAETSRNQVQKLTYDTWPPLIPAGFTCPECPTASEPIDASRDYSWGVILGVQDIAGQNLREVGLTHGRKFIEFELSRSSSVNPFQADGMWNFSINPKIRYKKRK